MATMEQSFVSVRVCNLMPLEHLTDYTGGVILNEGHVIVCAQVEQPWLLWKALDEFRETHSVHTNITDPSTSHSYR